MKIFENIINHKVNSITEDELLKYAKQFQVSINRQQARKIVDNVRGKNINIFNEAERTKLVKEIAKIAGPETAREVNKLLLQFSK